MLTLRHFRYCHYQIFHLHRMQPTQPEPVSEGGGVFRVEYVRWRPMRDVV